MLGARWRVIATSWVVIPERIIVRPRVRNCVPIDRPGFAPAYHVLDEIIGRYMEWASRSPRSSLRVFAEIDVRRVVRLIRVNEYKRPARHRVGIRITHAVSVATGAIRSPIASMRTRQSSAGSWSHRVRSHRRAKKRLRAASGRVAGARIGSQPGESAMKQITAVIQAVKLDEVREHWQEVGVSGLDRHRRSRIRAPEGHT